MSAKHSKLFSSSFAHTSRTEGEIEIRPQGHLINILKTTRQHHPNFALLLGAGASKASGVRLASEMIREWQEIFCHTYARGETSADFLAKCLWHNTSDEYSMLFEILYDQPSQRREYIESCIKDARPSWGYIYLVNLLKNKVFNTVFTTNFDDLLNEACYLFSDDIRPIVCAHDSSVGSVRLSSKRPKIIKLHGDFLFENIKNTLTELQSMENNVREKFKQYANEFGLIVVGYAGNDRSVMDTLSGLLKTESNFPNGIYWCVRKEDMNLSPHVIKLSRFPRFNIVEIEGFDSLFAEIQEKLELPLQPEMSDPYSALARRLDNLIHAVNVPSEAAHPTIEKDIRLIAQKLSSISDAAETGFDPTSTDAIPLRHSAGILNLPIPFEFLAQIEERNGKPDEALKYLLRQINSRPTAEAFFKAFSLAVSSEKREQIPILIELMKLKKGVLASQGMQTSNISLILIDAKEYEAADAVLDFGYELYQGALSNPTLPRPNPLQETIYLLNKLQIKRHNGEILSAEERLKLTDILKLGDPLMSLGTYILLDSYDLAEKTLSDCIEQKRISRNEFENWPIFKLLKPHLKFPNPFERKPPASLIQVKSINSE